MRKIEQALVNLKDALAARGMKLEKILVDKTIPTKYELMTGYSWSDEPRVACDPFTRFEINGINVVGRDNEAMRNHPEWPHE